MTRLPPRTPAEKQLSRLVSDAIQRMSDDGVRQTVIADKLGMNKPYLSNLYRQKARVSLDLAERIIALSDQRLIITVEPIEGERPS